MPNSSCICDDFVYKHPLMPLTWETSWVLAQREAWQNLAGLDEDLRLISMKAVSLCFQNVLEKYWNNG
ncbi:hypothetical protein CsSME_00039266 [Camellia sinensis var. sinensis]